MTKTDGISKEDDLTVEQDLTYDDFATVPVPAKYRRSTFSVAMVAAGFCISMSGLFTGAAMATGLNFREALIAAIIGNVILSFYGGAVGIAGTKEGLSASRLAIYSFGNQGFKLVSLVLALTMAGWFSVQAGLFGNTINAMFPNAGFITNPSFAGFWGGILMLLTAYVGFKGLSILSNIAVPAIAIAATAGVIAAISTVGGWSEAITIQPAEQWGVAAGIVMVVGSFAAGASAQADISRYSRDSKSSIVATLFGYMIANTFIIMAGYLTTLSTGIADLPKSMLQLGLGIPALLVLVLAQWTTNDNNLYTASLGLSNILPLKRNTIVLGIGILGSIVGGLGIANYFVNWLNVLGIGVPPMAGVIIADYYLIRKQDYASIKLGSLPNINNAAIISWIVGIIVGFTVKWGIASINSLVATMVVYFLLMKVRPTKLSE